MANLGGWGISTIQDDGRIHIAPFDDLKEHLVYDDRDQLCECGPLIEIDKGIELVIHNSFDGREAFETGQRKLS